MKKILLKMALLASALFLFTGCNYEQIHAGTKGKVLGPNGWEPELLPPSTITINGWFTSSRNKRTLYAIETTTEKFSEPITVRLKDKTVVKFNLFFTGQVTNNDDVVNGMFNVMKMTKDDRLITVEEVYEKFGKQIVFQTARAVVNKYNIDELLKNYDRINKQMQLEVTNQFKGLPIVLSKVTIGEPKLPKILEESINKAKEVRLEIEQAKAQALVDAEKSKGTEAKARAQYNIKILEAKRIRDYNKITAKGITKDLITLRKLELKDKELDIKLEQAKRWDGKLPANYTSLGGNSDESMPIIYSLGNKK